MPTNVFPHPSPFLLTLFLSFRLPNSKRLVHGIPFLKVANPPRHFHFPPPLRTPRLSLASFCFVFHLGSKPPRPRVISQHSVTKSHTGRWRDGPSPHPRSVHVANYLRGIFALRARASHASVAPKPVAVV